MMGITDLIKIASVLAILTVSFGKLPIVLKELKVAQFKLLKDSQASKWGVPMLPPER